MRLLFDELLPWKVAKALQVLDFPVSYVGDESANPASPERGSSDEVVLEHAERANQVIVTSNLDMILLCAEQDQRVVWIDPRGKKLRKPDLVVLIFRTIHDWDLFFQKEDHPVCLRVLRTKTEIIPLNEAGRRVGRRMSDLARRKSRKPAKELGPLA